MKENILPLRDMVFSPGLTVPIFLDNPISINCINSSAKKSHQIILAPQNVWNYPTNVSEIYDYGTLADVIQVLTMPDGSIHAVVKTTNAVKITDKSVAKNGIFSCEYEKIEILDDTEFDITIALRDRVADALSSLAIIKKFKMDKLRAVINDYPMPAFLDTVIQMLDIDADFAIQMLIAPTWREKLLMLLEKIQMISELGKIEDSINRRVNQQLNRGQRDAILQEKLRAIHKEMGEDSEEADAESLKKKIMAANLSDDARDKVLSELRRMKAGSPNSPDSAVARNYIEEVLAMPWDKSPFGEIDLKHARNVLDRDHSAMTGVKERILEHIAVMKKTKKQTGSILCLVGAPGVGKTSLGKSVADALGRKYVRISLGGISDEAHFRGHRKTYLGSQPGRIMDALKRAKVNNPVIVLDEIDKMGRDHRGNPESALLEILDPEQNKTFRDHYLEVDFDLSDVLFIATSNSLNMSQALKDRMEIIEIPSYTENEKVQIAREHLISRAGNDTGWAPDKIEISDDAILHTVRNYTSESGVRELSRVLNAILRRALLENDGEDCKMEFTPQKIDELLALRRSGNVSHRIGFRN